MVNYLIKGRGLQPSKGRFDQPYSRTKNAKTVHIGQGKRLEMFIHLQFWGSSDTVVCFCILALITCFYQRPHSIESTGVRVGGIFNWAFKDKKKNRVSFMFQTLPQVEFYVIIKITFFAGILSPFTSNKLKLRKVHIAGKRLSHSQSLHFLKPGPMFLPLDPSSFL